MVQTPSDSESTLNSNATRTVLRCRPGGGGPPARGAVPGGQIYIKLAVNDTAAPASAWQWHLRPWAMPVALRLALRASPRASEAPGPLPGPLAASSNRGSDSDVAH